VHHRYTRALALKRRRNNPGLGCFRKEERMSLVITQAEMPFMYLKTCARRRRDTSGRPWREPTSAGMGRVR
jgi:hypothetical protein